MLVEMMDPTTLLRIPIAAIPLVSYFPHPLVQHFVQRSLFPKWYHQHERNVHSLLHCEEFDADKLPAVGSTGGLNSLTISHHLFIDKCYSLQNGPSNGPRKILTLTPFAMV